MIKMILDVLPHVKGGRYIDIAKGKNKLPLSWGELTKHIKGIKNGSRRND